MSVVSHLLSCTPALLVLPVLWGVAAAQDVAPEQKPAKPPAVQMQPADDVAEPLEPLQERTPETEQTIDAMSWYGIGRMEEAQGNFRKALAAYRKALELDPNRVAIYRSIVPLAFSLNETEEGLKYALRLVEIQPEDVQLLQQLARVLVTRGQLSRATDLLKRGLQSGGVPRKSAGYVNLSRDLGVIYGAQGNVKEAAAAFEVVFEALQHPEEFEISSREHAALTADPETTYERLGQVFLEAERSNLAIAAFEAAGKARRGKPGVLQHDLARVYFQEGRYEDALKQLTAYIEQKRTDRERAPYDLYVQVLSALNQQDRIAKRLEEIVAADPDNAFAKLTLADHYRTTGDQAKAMELYVAALEKVKDAAGFLGLAASARQQGKSEPIIESLARAAVAGASDEELGKELDAVAADEKLTGQLFADADQKASAEPRQIDFATAFLLGKLALAAERIDDANRYFTLAMTIRPDRVASLAEELAQGLMQAERYNAAAEMLQTALDRPGIDDSSRVGLLFRLTQILELDGQTEAALKTLKDAQKLAPDVALLHYQEGWIHLHADNYEQAEKAFLSVIEQFADEAAIVKQTQLSLSALYVEQGDKAKGLKVLEDVYKEYPDDPAVNNDLGYLYAEQGIKLEQAEKMIRLALEAEPENAAYLDSMGWVLYQRGKAREAVTYLERAVADEDGQDATLYEHLGACYFQLGNLEKAREAWQKGLEVLKPMDDAEQRAKLEERISQLSDGAKSGK